MAGKYYYEIEGSDCMIYEDPEGEPVDVIDLHEYIKTCGYGKDIEALQPQQTRERNEMKKYDRKLGSKRSQGIETRKAPQNTPKPKKNCKKNASNFRRSI